MGNKNNLTQFGQMALTDRVAIEVGIAKKQTFEKIGKTIGRSPVTVAREIKANRTKLPPEYPFGNDCKLARHCEKKHMCGADPEACDEKCKKCRGFNCHENCVLYESVECHQTDRPPYVCNNCYYRTKCKKTRYYYNAKHADATVSRRRSSSRKGIRLTEEQIDTINGRRMYTVY